MSTHLWRYRAVAAACLATIGAAIVAAVALLVRFELQIPRSVIVLSPILTLLFVGGAMNLPWIVALSAAVALEKVAPLGECIGQWFGVALLVVGFEKLLVAGLY